MSDEFDIDFDDDGKVAKPLTKAEKMAPVYAAARKSPVRYCVGCGSELKYNVVTHKRPSKFCDSKCRAAFKRGRSDDPIDNLAAMGMPEIRITDKDWDVLKTLAFAHCTIVEAARYMKMAPKTLETRLRLQADSEHPDGFTWTSFSEEFQADAKAQLRVKLFETAMGSNKMSGATAIFLAKNWLGMADNIRSEVTRKAPPKSKEEVDKELMEIFRDAGKTGVYEVDTKSKKVN